MASILSMLWEKRLDYGFDDNDLIFDNKFSQQSERGKDIWNVQLGVTDRNLVYLRYIFDCPECGGSREMNGESSYLAREVNGPCLLVTTLPFESLCVKKLRRRILKIYFPGGAVCYFKLSKLQGCGRAWVKWRSLVTKWRQEKYGGYSSGCPAQQKFIHFVYLQLELQILLYNTFSDTGDSSRLSSVKSEEYNRMKQSISSKGLGNAIERIGCSITEDLLNKISSEYKDNQLKGLAGQQLEEFEAETGKAPTVKREIDQGKISPRITKVVNRFGEGIKEGCTLPLTMSIHDQEFLKTVEKKSLQQLKNTSDSHESSQSDNKCIWNKLEYEQETEEDNLLQTVSSNENKKEPFKKCKIYNYDLNASGKEQKRIDSNQDQIVNDGAKKTVLPSMRIGTIKKEKIEKDKDKPPKDFERFQCKNVKISSARERKSKSTAKRSSRITKIVNRFGEGVAEGCILPLTMSVHNQELAETVDKISPEQYMTTVEKPYISHSDELDDEEEVEGFFDCFSLQKVISNEIRRKEWRESHRRCKRCSPRVSDGKQISVFPEQKNINYFLDQDDRFWLPRNAPFCPEVLVGTALWLTKDFSSLAHLRRWNSNLQLNSLQRFRNAYLQKNESLPNLHELGESQCADSQLFGTKRLKNFKNTVSTYSESSVESGLHCLSFWILDDGEGFPPDTRIYCPDLMSQKLKAHAAKISALRGFNQPTEGFARLEEKSGFQTYSVNHEDLPKMEHGLTKVLDELRAMYPKRRQRSMEDTSTHDHRTVSSEGLEATNFKKWCPFSNESKDQESACFASKLFDMGPFLLAHQLTQIDLELYTAIQVKEVLKLVIRPRTVNQLNCPHLCGLILFCIRIAHLVTSTVLGQSQINERVRMIAFFVQVAEDCEKLDNRHSACAVLCGVASPLLIRMSRTWALFKDRYLDQYTKLKRLLTTCFEPKVNHDLPFLGAFLNTILSTILSQAVKSPLKTRMTDCCRQRWTEAPDLYDWIYANSKPVTVMSTEPKIEQKVKKRRNFLKLFMKKLSISMWNIFSKSEEETPAGTASCFGKEMEPFVLMRDTWANIQNRLAKELTKVSYDESREKINWGKETKQFWLLSNYNDVWQNSRLSYHRERSMEQHVSFLN